ncbi:FAD-dependent oxidoreductase [Sphingomonas ginsenosidimutans]|jgi:D-arginine dehydrogenase|uniref:FAD-dependent oxidoreductase n=1 Tax=Sphingomonas ginsenosidimutans TaxID=862134 RepID=A0A2A4I1S9_9SPHN|nr:FAD-dependent oxidoreductase [Sphingomonas ginsenosidimutans]PCG10213.1 FAD-dependent oxidoreductase [Sphingomonas ginsenosidimutans]
MTHDIAIVGAGIAGATLAAAIGTRARVLLLEGEDTPGYHATGRSAAFWSETYGGAGIQPLTTASEAPLRDGGYLDPLGALHVGRADADERAAAALLAEFAGTPVVLEAVDPAARVAGLRDGWTLGVWEPSCAYIDVGQLHTDALAQARRAGAQLVTGAQLAAAERRDGAWQLAMRDGRTFSAATLVDAAGAWADAVAAIAGARPLGIRPYRRTMVQLATDPAAPAGMPFVNHLGGDFYFKPEAGGKLWLSPHDEHPVEPHDVAAEEIDVAIAIDRFEGAVDWRVTRVERRWAGLRSFAPDRLPVYGADPRLSGFFWFAGQGGFGIQTAPAAAAIGAALLLGQGAMPPGVDADRYAPGRFG